MVVGFIVICGLTVLIAFLNNDWRTGIVMMAVNLAFGGFLWGVMAVIRLITKRLHGPPPKH